MPRPVAADVPVDRIGLDEFIRHRHAAVLCTQRGDGTPQMSPVTMGVDTDGSILVASYPERAKVHNLRARPQASVCVLSETFAGEWVQVSGSTTVIDVPRPSTVWWPTSDRSAGSIPIGTNTVRP